MVVISYYEDEDAIVLRYYIHVPLFFREIFKMLYILPIELLFKKKIKEAGDIIFFLSGLLNFYYNKFKESLMKNIEECDTFKSIDELRYPPNLYGKLAKFVKNPVFLLPTAYYGIILENKNKTKCEIGLSILDDYSPRYSLGSRADLCYILAYPVDFTIWFLVEKEKLEDTILDDIQCLECCIYKSARSLEELIKKKSKEYQKSKILRSYISSNIL